MTSIEKMLDFVIQIVGYKVQGSGVRKDIDIQGHDQIVIKSNRNKYKNLLRGTKFYLLGYKFLIKTSGDEKLCYATGGKDSLDNLDKGRKMCNFK